jgi:hypothetical protein
LNPPFCTLLLKTKGVINTRLSNKSITIK